VKCEDVTPVRVSVIIVAHDSERIIVPCLSSIVRQMGDLTFEIILVDNASLDGTVETVRREFPEVRLIENQENVGFAAANNQGAAVAKGAFLCLLNSDTELRSGTLQAIQYAKAHHTAILGPKTVDADGNVQRSWDVRNSVASYIGDIFSMALFLRKLRRRQEPVPETPTAARFLVGSALLIDAEAWQRHGLLDERFFFSCEERDLCFRYARAGEKIVFFPGWLVLHHGATGRPDSRFHVENWIRSSLLFADKHGRTAGRIAMRIALLLFLLSYSVVSVAKGVLQASGPSMRRSGLYATLLCRFFGMMFSAKRNT